MARITSVDVSSGIPTAGTGTVATLDGVLDATNGPVTTKAANTVPVTATDKALVTVLRPDSPGIITTGAAGTPSVVVLSVQGVASGTPQNVAFPSDQAASVAATFTPAATSHTAGDCNGAAQTFAAMGLSGRPIMITGASLEIDGGTAEATAWRLYLYNVTPPSATADDGAWDLVSGDRASYLGYVDLGTAADLGSTQWVETQNINKQVKLSGTALFGYLTNVTTLTPAAVAHIVTLHAVQL